jgi:hypothetical protein
MRSDIVPGGVFPDYELPDHTNTVRRVSELQGDDPLQRRPMIETYPLEKGGRSLRTDAER